MYDVFFLSYDEPMADKHWSLIKDKVGSARRVAGVDGIREAHLTCAKLSRTKAFYVVDADNVILNYDFGYKIPEWDMDYAHLWMAQNPLNGLVYGWGGIKLFPKKLILGMSGSNLDMTTSFPLKLFDEVKSITNFNYAPLDTWRSAFRECVKLSLSSSAESVERLRVWTSRALGPFSTECLRGARDGRDWAETHRDNPEMLAKINDYTFLKAMFEGKL